MHKFPKFLKLFTNGSSANMKFSKNQLSKMMQSGGIIRDIPISGNISLTNSKKGTDTAKILGKKISG